MTVIPMGGIRTRRSGMAETMVKLEGRPFSLEDYPFFRKIYDGYHPRMLLKCGRQVAKSTTGANLILIDSMAMPHFKTLYIAPTQNQSFTFSKSRLQKMISHSPDVTSQYVDPVLAMNVRNKQLANGSEMYITYANDDPDRTRGYSSDRNVYDEIQDMLLKHISEVADECMANSDFGWVLMAGTPKSMENGIELVWQQSTQDEWCIPCEGCGKWNFVESEDSIGKQGVICVNCGKYLNTRHPKSQWVPMNPGAEVRGFHIPQLILPRNNEVQARWDRILYKYENYDDTRFRNEVLGISDAIGTRLVSKQDLIDLCRNYQISWEPNDKIFNNVKLCVAGVDWSGGGSSQYTSRTVVHIWGLLPDGRLKTMYYHVFATNNPAQDVMDVIEICEKYNVQMVVGDAGVGAVPNSMLVNALGAHRVVQAQYGSLSKLIKWNGRDRYMVDRTAAIDTMMLKYKKGGVIFANERQMAQAIDDILAEYEEVTKTGQGKKIWSHSPLVPDDCLHAQVFGWLAMDIITHKIEFYETADAA